MPAAKSWLQSLITVIVAVAAVIPPAGSPQAESQSAAVTRWVGSWAVAVTPAGPSGIAATGVANTTLRQVAHLSVGGSAVRLHLSNRYGTRPLVVGRVTVAPRRDAAAGTPMIQPLRLVPVTFGEHSEIAIPVGGEAVSDPIGMTVADDSDLVVSTYFPYRTGRLTQHASGFATGFAAGGDQVGNSGSAYRRMAGMARYVVAGVDVRSAARGSVVLFGDSITDGASTPIDRNLRYPDQLADLLLIQRPERVLGVLNAGIGGNRLLANGGTAGAAAIGRFDRDVVSRTGVRSVVVLEGINDIRASRGGITGQQLIAAQRQLVQRARTAGLKVYGGTLTPYWASSDYTVAGEVARQALNQWIRTSGEYDGVVDFDRAIRDPRGPLQILPAYDSGDHLHPNASGFTAMARAVNPQLLSN